MCLCHGIGIVRRNCLLNADGPGPECCASESVDKCEWDRSVVVDRPNPRRTNPLVTRSRALICYRIYVGWLGSGPASWVG